MSGCSSGHVPKSTLLLAAAGLVVAVPSARAAPWEEATDATIGMTGGWSNKVEIADIDGDGRPDILFANGAGYDAPDDPEQNRAFLNQGAGAPFLDVSAEVFSGPPDYTRAIKARDVDGDGAVDLLVANTYETQSRLYLGDGQGGFVEATDGLPQDPRSFGDAELGDVDGDGDLDAVLADWGPGNASQGAGRTRLWLGDGAGGFTDVTDSQMPDVLVGWSWELELVDVDNDLDLDVLVACKACGGSFMFVNDGAGVFTDASDRLPQYGNNYDFEPIDLTGDGFVDLVTINDGPQGREHVFVNDGLGGFLDGNPELWPDPENEPGDDNMVVCLDFDSDGDADFVIAGLYGSDDRVMINSGDGHLTLTEAFMPANSPGTLGIAVSDLDGDARIDVVMAEGEIFKDDDRVFLGVDIAPDTAGPHVSLVTVVGDAVHARIHDNKTPVMAHDFTKVVLVVGGQEIPMQWYGEALWRGTPGAAGGQVCAVDAAGNQTCAPFGEEPGETEGPPIPGETEGTTAAPTTTDAPTTGATTDDPPATTGGPATTSTSTTDPTGDGSDSASAGGTGGGGDEGCGCRHHRQGGGLLAFGLLALARRRRR